jgi:hypothetical protein
MTIEIVDIPIKMVVFHSFSYVYQRVVQWGMKPYMTIEGPGNWGDGNIETRGIFHIPPPKKRYPVFASKRLVISKISSMYSK